MRNLNIFGFKNIKIILLSWWTNPLWWTIVDPPQCKVATRIAYYSEVQEAKLADNRNVQSVAV